MVHNCLMSRYLGLIGLGHLAVDSLLDGLRFSRTVTALIDKLEQKYIDTPQALNLVGQVSRKTRWH